MTETASEKGEPDDLDQSEGAVGGVMVTPQMQAVVEEEEYVVKVFGKNDPRPQPDDVEEGQGQGLTVDEGQIVDEQEIKLEIARPQAAESDSSATHRRHSKPKVKVNTVFIWLEDRVLSYLE